MRTEEEGFALNDVGHDNSLLSSPQVDSEDPSEKGQDGFPIKNVGNDRDGDGFSINVAGNDEEEKIPFGTGLTEEGPSVLST